MMYTVKLELEWHLRKKQATPPVQVVAFNSSRGYVSPRALIFRAFQDGHGSTVVRRFITPICF